MQEKGLKKGSQHGNTIPPRSHDGPYFPLSSAQQRLWFLNQFADTQEVFNVHSAVKLTINIDAKHLSESVALIVERHESLRTLFKKIDGQPRQYVANSQMHCFEHHDIMHIVGDENINHEIQHANDAQRKQIFDLQKGPLLKVTLLSFAPSLHVLILTLHHIVSDGVSISILMGELFDGYAALESGHPPELQAMDVQYIDYACWQQDRLSSKVVQTQLAFWTETLERAPQILDMPTDYPRPKKLSYLGRAHDFQISGDLLAQLKSRSKEWGCSLFMLGLTAYCIVLGRYSGQSDMLIGTDIANRNSLQLKPLIGFFINQLVLRCRWSEDPSLHELTQFIRQTCLRAYANQDVPFNHLVEQFVTERDQSRTPLFQAKFVLDNSVGAVSTPDQVAVIEWETEAVEFDIELAFKELDGVLEGRIRYRSELFSADTIESFADYYQAALTAIVEQPNLPLSELSLLMPAEQQLVQESNQTQVSTPEIVLIDALLAYHQSEQKGSAVQHVNAVRSFGELRQDVEQMAAYFLDRGLAPGDTLAVCVERNVDLLIVHLAILRIGACYVPIDLDYGSKRINYILDDCRASILIVSAANEDSFSDSNPDQLVLPSDWRENWRAELPPTWPSVTSSQLAYMIYTSGSTGKPKGVAISLASLSNFLYSMKTLVGLNSGDSLLSVTTVSFDIAGLELYLPLLCKARLFIADQQHARDSRMLLSLIKSESISAMQATPATWSALCDVAGEQTLPSLCALCGGEALTEELAKRLLVFAGKLINLYGPTETTIWSSALIVTKSNIEGLPYAPLGQAIANTQVYVLDANGNQQLSGVPGELFIAGHGLAHGYQGRAALTAEAFLPNPFVSDAGSRLYKTGDCVKRLHDGGLVYLGRYDHQIKVRGYRIEIGEIEVVLKLHKDVESAFVVAKKDATGFNTLHAFVCLTSSASKLIADARQTNTIEPRLGDEMGVATEAEILQEACDSILNDAAQYLPAYMAPSVIQVLSKPPQTANGKVDRKALIAIAENSNYTDHATNKTAPSSALECQIAAHWQTTLSLEGAFLEQDFFRNGGHSLLAIQLLDRIEKD
ncbi:MAG: amino acid adenylation domain-containing protein, partial [Arenicella sp.]|nr:amino acid adenylation domain-containing protein [Arenicella sp.]